MLHIITYRWGSKYGGGYLEKLVHGVRRHLSEPYRFVLATDQWALDCRKPIDDVWPIPKEDRHLLDIKGCLARLRLFDPNWQAQWAIQPGDRIACLDLDLIVTGPLDPVFNRDDSFTILQGVNTSNPNPYNGSIWMLKAGEHADVWTDFSLESVGAIPYYAFPDDQAWFHHKIPNAAGWGAADGVYAFQKKGWPTGNKLPSNARIVAFPGHRDPSQFVHLDWIKEHWC